MKTKRGLRLVSFLMAVCMLTLGAQVIEGEAASGTQITITADGQVVDTFNGVPAVYRPGAWDGTDSVYGCHAYVINYYKTIYGKTVYNLFHKQTPMTYGDYFVVVSDPQPGDICAQIKSSTNHWSIVKSVSGDNVTVIDQNNKWVIQGVTYAYSNYTYSKSEVTFYRLASMVNGGDVTTQAPPFTETEVATTQAATTQTVSGAVMNVNKGCKKRITAKYVARLSEMKAVSWKSSKKKIAKVSNKGYVTGVKKGSATVTGTFSDGQKVALKVKVKVPKVEATSLKLISKDVTLPKNTSWTLTAKMKPARATSTLSFKSSNPSIATVNSHGVVTSGDVRGNTIITVKTSNGLKKKCIVRVY